MSGGCNVLIVDDNEDNREVLARRLRRQSHTTAMAANGVEALAELRRSTYDLVLLDIMMPEMNGYEVLEHMRADQQLRHIPVIVISAIDDMDSIVRCIELGAEDYLFKPFNPVLLRARIGASLEKKRLRDQEQAYLKAIQAEKERSEELLLNILPRPIADRLREAPGTIADLFSDVTVLFADLVDFTKTATSTSPELLVEMLNDIFSRFDSLTIEHGLEKIKTIGDAYMVVGGLPTPHPDHAAAVAELALAMLDVMTIFRSEHGLNSTIRIGINSGPVVAGVIGTHKFSYDLWGDTVNTASRMESHGTVGGIQVTEATYALLKDRYTFEDRGEIEVKGKGLMHTYLLTGRR